MARRKSPQRKQAKDIYIRRDGHVKLKDIAEELEVSAGTVRNWKRLDNWNEALEKKQGLMSQIQVKKSIKSNKPLKSNKGTGSRGSIGNSGGGAPIGNQNAFKHGAFSKIIYEGLDDDSKSIIDALVEGGDIDEDEILDTRIILASLLLKSTVEVKKDFIIDPFGKKHTVDISLENKSKRFIAISDHITRLQKFKFDKEKFIIENKQKDRNSDLKERLVVVAEQRLDGPETEIEGQGVIMIPEKSTGKDNEQYEVVTDEQLLEG